MQENNLSENILQNDGNISYLFPVRAKYITVGVTTVDIRLSFSAFCPDLTRVSRPSDGPLRVTQQMGRSVFTLTSHTRGHARLIRGAAGIRLSHCQSSPPVRRSSILLGFRTLLSYKWRTTCQQTAWSPLRWRVGIIHDCAVCATLGGGTVAPQYHVTHPSSNT